MSDVANRMVKLVAGGAAGRVRELGGPKIESMADLMRAYLAAAGRRRAVVNVPFWGQLGVGLGVGGQLVAADGDRGAVSFADYLQARLRAGAFENPYH